MLQLVRFILRLSPSISRPDIFDSSVTRKKIYELQIMNFLHIAVVVFLGTMKPPKWPEIVCFCFKSLSANVIITGFALSM